MLTINADAHPLMSRMHKPDPKLAANKQDKRSVIPLAPEDYDVWLAGTVSDANTLIRLASVELFAAGPVTA
ncbi:hypothetical protein [Acidovorax sp. RAC01]|uniref:hypothetical protein n=1 Tax=Acidovorax sp. RAC01 TaxID=1842533 RepID=UPI00083E75C7|nr:putative gp33 [Acidovorax sp. RAC01]